jgi:hypothetical protein
LLAGGTLAAGAAHADPVKCRAAIGKNGAAFAQTKMKALGTGERNMKPASIRGVGVIDRRGTRKLLDKS